MFRIKICGITDAAEALMVVRAGADAVGLNFYPPSPRYISFDAARQIIAALPEGIVKVGVFVNAPPTEVCRAQNQLGLDLIQLHGDESPEYLAQLGNRPVMRAFRVNFGSLHPIVEYLALCRGLKSAPKLVLLDAAVPGEYGGTGKTADWGIARQYAVQSGLPPLVLAGGLTPDNVADAIAAVRPAAVDVAGGVESRPGRKDAAAVAAFVQAAREAFS